jgi:hypothetical protein
VQQQQFVGFESFKTTPSKVQTQNSANKKIGLQNKVRSPDFKAIFTDSDSYSNEGVQQARLRER